MEIRPFRVSANESSPLGFFRYESSRSQSPIAMCGIAGSLQLDRSRPNIDNLNRMCNALHHRGPDARAVSVSGPVGFAHARLSIIDLVSGAQPMRSSDGRFWITFNGEIFNYLEVRKELVRKGHTFQTQSDTEVILNAYAEYGEDCVTHFNGDWAFAIWDTREQTLFLSRDRSGVRPLFYLFSKERFLFASEVKALFACPDVNRELDPCGIDETFTFWAPIPPRTVFKDVSQLPPAHSLSIRGSQVRVYRYWSAPYQYTDSSTSQNEDALCDELLGLLEDATRIRLRSDVPVGAYLSGGIDSTITTALIGKIAGNQLRSFSIAFEDAQYDESQFQQEASSFLETRHSTISCSSADIANAFPQVIEHTEQPIVRTAPVPMYLLASLVRKSNFKVVLTGEGADEAFGGYDIFKEAKIRRFWARDLDSLYRPLLLKRLYPYLQNFQKQSSASLKQFFSISATELDDPLFSHLPRWQLTAKLKLLFSNDFRASIGDYDAFGKLRESLPHDFGTWSHFAQAAYLEAHYFLPGYLLSSQGDRMAMAHSVEGRYPFLDHRVLEFAAKLPPALKLKVLNEKYLLKRACKDLVPPSILKRRKQPYRAPDSQCFFQPPTPSYVADLLSSDAVARNGVFDPKAVSTLVRKLGSVAARGVKDDMALVGVLSTQLISEQFCTHRSSSIPCMLPILNATSAVSL